jgi:hypothetical protein
LALTQKKLQDLVGQGFPDLYQQHQRLWTDKAERAFDYAARSMPDGQAVRVDDVAGVLTPALEVDRTLRHFLQEGKLRQKYWVEWFCDYILDQLWGQLRNRRTGGGR